jgi:hypothetical protein
MEKYQDINGNSGIGAFEIGSDYIIVTFKDGSIYKYSYQSAGRENIEQMKRLARKGSGLNTFINRNVRKLFE